MLAIPELPETSDLVKNLAARNPDILAAELATDAARAKQRELDAAFYPRIDVSGGYQYKIGRAHV